MKHQSLIVSFALILLSLTLVGAVQANNQQVSFDDIVLLNQRGLSEQTILLFLQGRELAFTLDAKTIDGLLSKGVSEEIIRYLLSLTSDEDIVADTTVVVAAPVYPRRVYPSYYYTPYFYGASFGFDNYPHSWFGYYAGAGLHQANVHYGGYVSHEFYPGKHVNQYDHSITHAVQHAGGHNSGVTHGIAGGQHGSGFSDNNHPGSARPHGGSTGGKHAVAHNGQSAAHGANSLGHAVSAIGRPHAGSGNGPSHVSGGHSRGSGGHSSGGKGHSGGGGHSGGFSGGGHGGGRGH